MPAQVGKASPSKIEPKNCSLPSFAFPVHALKENLFAVWKLARLWNLPSLASSLQVGIADLLTEPASRPPRSYPRPHQSPLTTSDQPGSQAPSHLVWMFSS